MRRRLDLFALAAALVLVAAACGGSGDDGVVADSPQSTSAGSGARTVEVTMADIAYKPATISVKDGETVRFVFRNEGKLAHDAFIGDEAAQMDHEKQMSSTDTMAGMDTMNGTDNATGGDANGITVDPGKSGELTYTFRSGEDVLIGCHQPGHYKAGMKLTVDVT